MCGIAGIVDRQARGSHGAALTAMLRALVHRGPDDEGRYEAAGVALGTRRLKVIDLETGHQPLSNEEATLWVAFNGEIYNHCRLRMELERRGHRFTTRCDTEVIVHAWEEFGEDALGRFEGMFAIAVWDVGERTLWLARDRLGVKPLYYTVTPETLAFASEIKALLAGGIVSPEVDLQSLYHYIGYEFVPAPATMFRGVCKLRPGHLLRWRAGELTVRGWWDVRFTPTDRDPEEESRELRRLIAEAVEKRLAADVPLGVFLSGGLDSTAVLAYTRQATTRPVPTFTIGYRDASFSEWEYARQVARHFGAEHHEIVIDPVTPADVEAAVWHLDEPMTDLSAIPLSVLSRAARQQVTVCLSGEGNDEIFIGYDRFVASRLHEAVYARVPRSIRRRLIEPLVASLPDRDQKKGAVNLLKRFVEGAALPEAGGHLRWQYFSSPERDRALFAAGFLARVDADPFRPLRDSAAQAPAGDRLARESYLDLRFTMPDSVLMKVDKMSMAHSLEVRVPFLDHALVEFAARIPSRRKFPRLQRKAVYRRAMRAVLPDFVLARGKQGYSLPLKHWLRRELRPYLEATLRCSPLVREHFNAGCVERLINEHMSRRRNHNHVLWALLNAAIWHRRFVEQRPAASTSGLTRPCLRPSSLW